MPDVFRKDSQMIRTICISITFIAAALSAFGAARAGDPPLPSVKVVPVPAAGAAAAEDELRRTVDEMRNDMRELRRDVVKLRELLEIRAEGPTPAERAEFADLVDQYNKLVKQDRWGEAELIAKQAQELARGRTEQMPMSVTAAVMFEKARIGRQLARNAELKADVAPALPEFTIAGLDAATRLQAAKIHLFPNHPTSGRVETEMDLLKLAKASRLWSEVTALKKRGKTEQFVAACQRIIQAFPESDYAHLALDELAMAASGRPSSPAAPAPSALSVNQQSILAALKKPVSVNLTNARLAQFIEVLQKQGNMNVVVDNVGLNEVGKGINTPISISADHIALADAMKRVLEPLGLDYVIKDEVLLISSRSRCRPILEVRSYPVADLVTDNKTASGAKVDFEPLTKLITSTVEPASWEGSGGRGRIEPFENSLSLVIRQSEADHQKTSALLHNLRSMSRDVSLTAIIIDQSTVRRYERDREPEITPLSDQEVKKMVESTRGNGWTVQRTKLLLRFGAVASLALQTPQPDASRHDALTLESAVSVDRKRIGLSVGVCDFATGKPTRTSIETSIPNRQAVLIALKREQKLLIVRPEFVDEQEEALARP
jgi:ribosomal protein S8E